MSASTPRLTVVVATYNRPALLLRLLTQLGRQTLNPESYEVVVGDDGSSPPVRPALASLEVPYELRLEEQQNRGAAAARHRGIVSARGDVLVILDDDMSVGEDFLEQHLSRHGPDGRKVVIGRIEPDPGVRMPLFERWHAVKIADLNARFAAGETPTGSALYTGNVSLRRRDYLAAGGFDTAFRCSEDVEFGLRLEKAGVAFEYAAGAVTFHASDHASPSLWRARAAQYGAFERRLSRKHPDLPGANPWRFLYELHPLSRPLLVAAALAPDLMRPFSWLSYRLADGLGRLGLERAALRGAGVTFGFDYFRGVGADCGSSRRSAIEFIAYSAERLLDRGRTNLLLRALGEIRQDQAAMRRYEQKYGHAQPSEGLLPSDIVQRIGLQELAGYRLMRALRDAELPLAAKVVARSLRHLYGSDIHWEAELAPGIMLVHGFGLAISHAAKVGPACILFQNVTLGMGTDPETRKVGAPTLEARVHVGPGATLIGPIVVGAGSKIMAGVTLTRSVPAGSIVVAPEPEIRRRDEAPSLTPEGPRFASHG
jgi:serine acetyltransferase/GT2 family glycosyltransferase